MDEKPHIGSNSDSFESDEVDTDIGAERFVWPPRPLIDRVPKATLCDDLVGPSQADPVGSNQRVQDSGESTGTVIATVALTENVAAHTSVSHQSGVASTQNEHADDEFASASWWRVIERGWLGLKGLPLHDRLAQADWSADTPRIYCQHCGQTRPHTNHPTQFNQHDSIQQLQQSSNSASAGGSVAMSLSVNRCAACVNEEHPWDVLIRLSAYRDPLAGVVRDIKFTRWRSLGVDAGRLLGEQIAPVFSLLAGGMGGWGLGGLDRGPWIVPVPISYRRRVSRGIDHTRAIAEGVRQVVGGDVRRILDREHRPSQTSLPADERRRNLSGAIWCRRPPPSPHTPPPHDPQPQQSKTPPGAGSVVVVIDDVMTTGATMRAACGAIRKAERDAGRKRPADRCRIVAAVLCVADDRETQRNNEADFADSEYPGLGLGLSP